MTELLPNCSDSRQAALLGQILEVSEKNEERLLSFLQIKWAHRYGASTLPESNVINSSINDSLDQNKPIVEKKSQYNPADEGSKPSFSEDSGLVDDHIEPRPVPEKVLSIEEPELEGDQFDEVSDSEHSPSTPIMRLRTVFNEYLDGVNNAFKDKKNPAIEIVESSASDVSNIYFSSPPPRKPNRLSRWLPESKNNFPKAS